MAKQLIGQWSNLRPSDPEVFAASIAAALAGYPLGVGRECCDPRTGLSRKKEFLSIAAVVEWCDDKRDFHERLANYLGKRESSAAKYLPPPPDPVQAGLIGRMISGLVGYMRVNPSPSPVDGRERVEYLAAKRKAVLSPARHPEAAE